MNTNYEKVNILPINLKSIISLFIMIILGFSILIQNSFAQMETNTEKYNWNNKTFLKEINKERTKRKLSALKENAELNRLAKLRLDDMLKNNYFAHESPTGNGIDELLLTSSYDYEWRGENLAYGEYEDEKDVTKSWMKSKWHKYNILYPNFKEVGTAYAIADFKGGRYLVVAQVFGSEINI
jgi:uncharacterized protein YkwD